jgi:hypothetical protein
MDRESFRLELLKLTYRPGLQGAADVAIGDAKKLEAYCLESGGAESKEVPTEAKAAVPVSKKTGKNKGDNSIFE